MNSKNFLILALCSTLLACSQGDIEIHEQSNILCKRKGLCGNNLEKKKILARDKLKECNDKIIS